MAILKTKQSVCTLLIVTVHFYFPVMSALWCCDLWHDERMINGVWDETSSVLIISVSLHTLASLFLQILHPTTITGSQCSSAWQQIGLRSRGCIGLRGQFIGPGVTPNILIGLVTIMAHCTMLVFHGGHVSRSMETQIFLTEKYFQQLNILLFASYRRY